MRKLRIFLLLTGFAALALVSLVFGMMMSVAQDLPELSVKAQYSNVVNSYLYDDHGRPIGILAPPNHRVVDKWSQISPAMVHAIVAVEDRRFWTDPGVDIRGLARAFMSDLTGGPRQGASTIAEQYVKNALAEQNNRTIFEKLREAAMAYHLVHRWKRRRILTDYLNTIYFGDGAYGIESAARVLFGLQLGYDADQTATAAGATTTTTTAQNPNACGDPNQLDPKRPKCASKLLPYQAALIAGMVANPWAFDPIAHPRAARARRDLVLLDMYQQHYISRAQYDYGRGQPLPTGTDIQQPQEPPAAPYFTSWIRPQILAALRREGVPANLVDYRAFYGGLKIRTTIDLQLQQAAQNAIDAEFPPGSAGPTASLVAVDNHTGEVRAMVSGNNPYTSAPFNLATEGHRQPGSSFKPFTLAEALRTGEYGPYSIIDSAPQDFIVPNSGGREHFPVRNFGNTYSGPITLAEATAISDNTVFSQVGIHVGTTRIANLATAMGIRSPVSNNYAMILGGLKIGVSPLDMAHAYETFATGGLKVYNPTLGDIAVPHRPGPTGIAEIDCSVCPAKRLVDHPVYQRVVSTTVAATVHTMLRAVVSSGGTAPMAAIPGVDVVGKTGTTSNYVDAWFVGWTPQMTVAVWVGYPNKAIPMSAAYGGKPVEGGTYPAIIWHSYVVQALQILAQEAVTYGPHPKSSSTTTTVSTLPAVPSSAPAATPTTQTPAPAAPTTQAPAATPTAPASGGGGGTAGGTTPPATGGGGGTAGGTTPPGTGGGGGTTPPAGGGAGGSGSSGTGGAGLGGG